MTEQSASACTFAKLFPEQLANPCNPDAPESNTGPIAYLHALYQKVLEIEGGSNHTTRQTLAMRRPDISELLLDPAKLEQPVSALALAIHTLTHHAQERAGVAAYLPEALANAGQHVNLPFNYAHEQLKAGLKYKKIPHFELLQQAEYSYPSFCHPQLRTDELRQVMRNASGFSPALQALLLDDKALRSSGNHWRTWYGMEDIAPQKAINSLLDVETFGRRTGLSFEEVLELLAVAGIDDDATASYSQVHSSTAYRPNKPALTKFHYGAAYINARRKSPLTIKDTLAGAGIKPQFNDLDYDALSRMYQMIHLQRALALPFSEVDLLLTSILRAEGQTGNWHFTANTLRALGVFRYFSEAYGITAEQFAALVCEVNAFAVGDQVPMLDRVLDGPGAGQPDTANALILDDRTFDPNDGNDGQFKVVPALAKAMGVDEQTTRVYLAQAKLALGVKTLSVSLTLLSSLYRLSRLHRLLKRSAREADALVKLLATTGTDVLAQMAGKPVISDTQPSDVLDALIGLSNLDLWLRQQQIPPSVLLETLAPVPDTEVILGNALLVALKEQRPFIDDMVQPSATSERQEELVGTLLMIVFGNQRTKPHLTLQHAKPLLGLCGTTALELLQAAITVMDTPSQPKDAAQLAAAQLWFKLERRYALCTLLRVSAGALMALYDNPGWFDLEQAPSSAPSLDLCYQLSRFQTWVELCRANGADEHDAIAFLAKHRESTEPKKVTAAAKALGTLIGWSEAEVEAASPTILTLMQVEDDRPTFDDFLQTLSDSERAYYDRIRIRHFLRNFVVRTTGGYKWERDFQGAVDKLLDFLNHNPGPLLVTKDQSDKGYRTDEWLKTWEERQPSGEYGYFPITLEVLADRPKTVNRLTGVPCVPSNMSDIDFVLRLKALCDKTGLACTSLLSLSELNEHSPYQAFEAASQLIMASTDDALRETIDKPMHERWRDALAGYLIAYWAPPEPEASASITSFDELSTFCLSDICVSSDVTTTLLNQAIGSLQHYLSRLFARLEPGYGNSAPSGQAQVEWQNGLGQYGTWKRNRERSNHPANLIYYANRPNKSMAFQELEVELNQGKMDTSLLHSAICTYLAKFERISNLQVISGYLDGHDPKRDTYHFIAKTNTTPYEYYWRTLNMQMRDDQERLSPLAWSEWEKIDVAASGTIVQGQDGDIIVPVVIAGRRYTLWAERDSTDLPDPKDTGKTLDKKRKLTVNYSFQQSDGTWSTPNELMRLDGYAPNGAWQDSYAKDLDFKPSLIAVVNCEGKRATDPWLTVLLHDNTNEYIKDTNYFLEARDLLLINRQSFDSEEETKLTKALRASYEKSSTIKKPFDGPPLKIDSFRINYIPNKTPIPILLNIERPDPTIDLSEFSDQLNHARLHIDAHILSASEKKLKFTAKIISTLIKSFDFSVWSDHGPNHITDDQTENSRTKSIHCIFELNRELNITIITYFTIQDCPLNLSFTLTITCCNLEADEDWNISISKNTAQAQYLDLTGVKDLSPTLPADKIRLNTLFGKNSLAQTGQGAGQLLARANQSVDRVLAWDTQNLQEPALDDSKTTVPMDFHGANALYFRELFLHVPAMIAMRLTEQQQFEEAEDWYLRYLFNPYRTEPDQDGRPAPWATRPLAQVGTLSSTLRAEVDVVSRVFTLSRHYQQAIYLALLENWQRQGDHFYRQLTLSSLNQAWLCYQQALQLLGPLPIGSNASRWQAATLASLANDAFRRPVNRRVTDLHETLQSRLYNLRHGLTLDGKRLPPLDWNSESLDAFANTKGGVSNLPIPYRSGQIDIPHYRFRQLLPLAKAAAQQLSDFGRHYMSLMEEEFNTSLAVQLKAQDIKMADFAIRLQREAVSGVKAKKKGLLISREKTLAQEKYFSDLIDVGRSPEEEAATALSWTSKTFKAAAIYNLAIAGSLGVSIPTIYGLAVGGNDPGALNLHLGQGFDMASDISKVIADELETQAAYNRRAAQWAFDKAQAEWDLKILDQQITETNIELNASTIALAQCVQEKVNLQEAYVSMTTGFTIIPTYNWLVTRQEYIYGAAYDAVRALCMSAEAAWRYEIGDYRRDSFIDTTAWRVNWKGMLVGESLLVNLQQMENEYLARNERRLTIKKSFSLKKQLGNGTTENDSKWAEIFKADAERTTPLTHSFEFKAEDFDKSYPGQYLRQLKYVSVTLVLKTDKKVEELCAILKQTRSATLLEPDKNAARSFYPGKENDEDVTKARENPKLVLHNPREDQQIALSSTVAEDGLGYDAGTWVYELMFHDGRYLPYEGTGAISQWTLELLGDEGLLKDPSIIEDIQFNMVYTAKADDGEFIKQIGEIRKEAARMTQGNT
ncbi:hypothetical protein A0O30_08960 [Pseudomonas sp. LLC-1]|uniref:Tc toxin subunit A-related protein n=1 Tax=Pseudomonas sp. LLC-1 TaxID=1812180 RepID=UPI000D4FB3CD|nr:neuraminidase-like domain-containing protein [Pseudomonas sp. LLC-1]PRN05404.1 hypothetical protein A0O30_08960 [Pseudomonas sp. LLC-1]